MLVAATFAACANSLRAPWVYDDVQAITENESIRHLWPLARALLPLNERGLTVSGRPILSPGASPIRPKKNMAAALPQPPWFW